MNKLLVLMIVLGVTACGNREVYENILINQRNECLKEPSSRQEECLERANKSYEEYQRERKEVLEH
jgi:hypothetical protein